MVSVLYFAQANRRLLARPTSVRWFQSRDCCGWSSGLLLQRKYWGLGIWTLLLEKRSKTQHFNPSKVMNDRENIRKQML